MNQRTSSIRQKTLIVITIILISASSILSAKASQYQDDTELANYMRDLQRTIKANWKPKLLNQSYILKSKFKIDKSGNIHGIELLNKHSDEDINEAAIQALKKTKAPSFDKIKSLETSNNIDIEFTFDYKISKIQKKSTERTETNLHKDSVLSSKDTQKAEDSHPLKNILRLLVILPLIFWNLFFRNKKKLNPKNFNIQNKKPQFDQYYDPTDVKR
jgi:TonB C terminal